GNRNHEKFPASQKSRERVAGFWEWSAKEALHRSHENNCCDQKADTAIAVNAAAIANEPLKIKNSPINPFSPGKPSDENMATLIHPQSSGVRCISPPKSSMLRRPRRCSSNPTK